MKPTTSKCLWLLMLNDIGVGGGGSRCKMYAWIYTYMCILFFSDAITSGDLVALVTSGWYSIYKIVDLGFIPINKSSFST